MKDQGSVETWDDAASESATDLREGVEVLSVEGSVDDVETVLVDVFEGDHRSRKGGLHNKLHMRSDIPI